MKTGQSRGKTWLYATVYGGAFKGVDDNWEEAPIPFSRISSHAESGADVMFTTTRDLLFTVLKRVASEGRRLTAPQREAVKRLLRSMTTVV